MASSSGLEKQFDWLDARSQFFIDSEKIGNFLTVILGGVATHVPAPSVLLPIQKLAFQFQERKKGNSKINENGDSARHS
jgi:hypothetical protein